MIFALLCIFVFVFITLVNIIKTRRLNLLLIFTMFFTILSILIFYIYKLLPYNVRGAEDQMDQVFLFITMCLGMISNNLYQSIKKGNFHIEIGDLIKPLFVSPIVFLFFWGILQKMEETDIITYCFSFQNGFFWRIIFEKVSKSMSTKV